MGKKWYVVHTYSGYENKVKQSLEERLQAQLLQTRKIEAIGTLAGGIAHDFNNLLTAILGNISLAQTETGPESKAFEVLIEAAKAVMQARDLTARLITFSKGGDPFKKEVPLGDLIKDYVSSALNGLDIHPEFFIPDDLWPAYIDERQIKQVIYNIVINAVETMEEKGKISVYCENINVREKDALTLKPGRYTRVSIKDQGTGIPEENLAKIFDPYFSTKEMGSDKGMGLGLAVSHSIVKRHNGLITIESELGAGTTVHIYLPAVASPQAREAGEELRADRDNAAAVEKASVRTGKVLVVDDEEMMRNVTSKMLGKIGFEVGLAIEGSEAIKMYEKAKKSGRTYDVVILALTNKIGIGGEEAIRRLLEIDPGVKGIVSTHYSNDPIVTKNKKYGFCGALTKPFSMDELIKTVRSVLDEK